MDPLKSLNIFGKKSHNAEKNLKGLFVIFQHPFCRKTSKNEGDPLVQKIFTKKSHNAERTGRPFSLARYFMLRTKKEQLFCLSSLGQMVEFDTLRYRRTFENYFGQFVWIEKVTIYLFHLNFAEMNVNSV